MATSNGAQPKQLFLIDGNSLVYRAFFALPESIATSDGRPTNAIFGFASMLVNLVTDHGTAPTVVVWDAGSSGRKEVYEPYKAQRTSRPDLLREQWPAFEPLVEAFGHRNYKVDGFEADDVIATLAEQAKGRGIPVMVVTGDRDAFQIVGDGVRVMATSRGITETKVYGPDEVRDRYGISHELIPTSTASRATPRTTSRASPGSATRPRRTCCSGSATSRRCSPRSTRSPASSARRT